MAYPVWKAWPVAVVHNICLLLRRRRTAGTLGLTFLMIWTFLGVIVVNQPTVKRDISANISEFFRIQRDPFVNLHQYKYTFNSKVCETKDLSILVTVHSKPDFTKKRMVIRETLGTVNRVGNMSLAIVFMLGRVYNDSLQRRIQQESILYGDIVQGNFVDNYRNMTHKHVMLMHWVEKQCAHVKVIVKIDDDVIVNPFNLVSYIQETTSLPNSFHCLRLGTENPDRNPAGRYHIPYEQYPFEILPEYCPGFAYITTPDVYRKLCFISRDVRYLNMDDVYVTGVLALKTGVVREDISSRMLICKGFPPYSYSLNDVIFVLNERGSCLRDSKAIWRTMTNK